MLAFINHNLSALESKTRVIYCSSNNRSDNIMKNVIGPTGICYTSDYPENYKNLNTNAYLRLTKNENENIEESGESIKIPITFDGNIDDLVIKYNYLDNNVFDSSIAKVISSNDLQYIQITNALPILGSNTVTISDPNTNQSLSIILIRVNQNSLSLLPTTDTTDTVKLNEVYDENDNKVITINSLIKLGDRNLDYRWFAEFNPLNAIINIDGNKIVIDCTDNYEDRRSTAYKVTNAGNNMIYAPIVLKQVYSETRLMIWFKLKSIEGKFIYLFYPISFEEVEYKVTNNEIEFNIIGELIKYKLLDGGIEDNTVSPLNSNDIKLIELFINDKKVTSPIDFGDKIYNFTSNIIEPINSSDYGNKLSYNIVLKFIGDENNEPTSNTYSINVDAPPLYTFELDKYNYMSPVTIGYKHGGTEFKLPDSKLVTTGGFGVYIYPESDLNYLVTTSKQLCGNLSCMNNAPDNEKYEIEFMLPPWMVSHTNYIQYHSALAKGESFNQNDISSYFVLDHEANEDDGFGHLQYNAYYDKIGVLVTFNNGIQNIYGSYYFSRFKSYDPINDNSSTTGAKYREFYKELDKYDRFYIKNQGWESDLMNYSVSNGITGLIDDLNINCKFYSFDYKGEVKSDFIRKVGFYNQTYDGVTGYSSTLHDDSSNEFLLVFDKSKINSIYTDNNGKIWNMPVSIKLCKSESDAESGNGDLLDIYDENYNLLDSSALLPGIINSNIYVKSSSVNNNDIVLMRNEITSLNIAQIVISK